MKPIHHMTEFNKTLPISLACYLFDITIDHLFELADNDRIDILTEKGMSLVDIDDLLNLGYKIEKRRAGKT